MKGINIRVNERAQVWLFSLRPELGAQDSAERSVGFQYTVSTDNDSRRKPNSTDSTTCTWLTLLITMLACVEYVVCIYSHIDIYAIAQWRFEQVLLLSRVQVHTYKSIEALSKFKLKCLPLTKYFTYFTQYNEYGQKCTNIIDML